MKALLKKFLRDESGAALVEYGIALLVVILVGTGSLVALSRDSEELFGRACDASGNAVVAAGGTAAAGC